MPNARSFFARIVARGALRLLIALSALMSPSCHAQYAGANGIPVPATPAVIPLEVVVLGSGGPGATGRAGAAYLVLVEGKPRILVDAGPGSFVRLGESGLSMAAVDVVLLTHLHVDHAGELPGLFKARAVSTRGNISFDVFGPAGRKGYGKDANFPSTKKFIDLLFGAQGAFSYLAAFSAPMTIRAHDLDVSLKPAPAAKTIHTDGELSVSAVAGHHRDAPAVIYRIDYKGRSVTFSGDIDPEGHDGLRRIARDTDLLVFNAVVLDPPDSPPQLYRLHTAPGKIGEIAASAGARSLLLSHVSPAVEEEADAVTQSIARNFAGTITFAKDGLRIQP